MEVTTLFFLSAVNIKVGGVTEETIDCKKPAYHGGCPGNLYSLFPQSSNDIEPFCNASLKFVDCWKKHVAKCGPGKKHLNDITAEISFYEEMCRPSPLKQAIKDHMDCMNRAFYEDETCYISDIKEERVRKAIDDLRKRGFPQIAINGKYPEICIHSLYSYTCLAEELTYRCGFSAEYAYTEGFKKKWYPREYCRIEVLHYLYQISEILKHSVNDILKETKFVV